MRVFVMCYVVFVIVVSFVGVSVVDRFWGDCNVRRMFEVFCWSLFDKLESFFLMVDWFLNY